MKDVTVGSNPHRQPIQSLQPHTSAPLAISRDNIGQLGRHHVRLSDDPQKYRLTASKLDDAMDVLLSHTDLEVKEGCDKPSVHNVTPLDLDAAKKRLKKVMFVPVPQSNYLRVDRESFFDEFKTGTDFADFAEKVRRDLSLIDSTPSGRKLLSQIGGKYQHLTTIRTAGRDGEMNELAYKEKNKEANSKKIAGVTFKGAGCAAAVFHHVDKTEWLAVKNGPRFYDVDKVGLSSAIALAHELIHAARINAGARLEVTKKLKKTPPPISPEEVATVGRPDGRPSRAGIVTENAIRKDMDALYSSSIQPRRFYSGHPMPEKRK